MRARPRKLHQPLRFMSYPPNFSEKELKVLVLSLTEPRSQRPLARLGALRHAGHLMGITLGDMVALAGPASRQIIVRKALEDAKPYMDILDVCGLQLIPSEVFFAIDRADARQLARTCQTLKRRPIIIDQLRNHLMTDCRFAVGWISDVISFISKKIGSDIS